MEEAIKTPLKDKGEGEDTLEPDQKLIRDWHHSSSQRKTQPNPQNPQIRLAGLQRRNPVPGTNEAAEKLRVLYSCHVFFFKKFQICSFFFSTQLTLLLLNNKHEINVPNR
jgi:hypothetical protein